MGEAKRRREQEGRRSWPRDTAFRGQIILRALPGAPKLNGAKIRELTGDPNIPDADSVLLRAFESTVGERRFHVGFCLSNETGVSAIGVAVIERLMMEAPGAALHVAPIAHGDIAWDLVLRQRSPGALYLFCRPPCVLGQL